MRHAKRGRKLGREAQHRNLMLGTMAGQVIQHGRIKTTAPKAKEIRSVVDKLITTAKKDDLAARRRAVRVLKDKTIVRRLFEDVAPDLFGPGLRGLYAAVLDNLPGHRGEHRPAMGGVPSELATPLRMPHSPSLSSW